MDQFCRSNLNFNNMANRLGIVEKIIQQCGGLMQVYSSASNSEEAFTFTFTMAMSEVQIGVEPLGQEEEKDDVNEKSILMKRPAEKGATNAPPYISSSKNPLTIQQILEFSRVLADESCVDFGVARNHSLMLNSSVESPFTHYVGESHRSEFSLQISEAISAVKDRRTDKQQLFSQR